MLKRVWNIASWGLLVGGAVVVLIAWSPSLRLRFGSTTNAADRGASNDFTLTDLDGRTFRLAEHRGQVVLVNFWATWCPPCRAEMPDLVSLQSHYGARGFQVVGVNMDEDRSSVPAFVRKYGLNYPILLPNGSFPLSDGIEGLPTSILIDSEGRIARRYLGMISEAAVRGDIDALLAERKTH